MAIPYRGITRESETYFVTANCDQHKALLQSPDKAALLMDVILHYWKEQRFLLHAFVVMPNHFHVLITTVPDVSLERAVQFIKGGFSVRAKKELQTRFSIWQSSFVDRRVRDAGEYSAFYEYILANPVKATLCAHRDEWSYSSAKMQLDPIPPQLTNPSFRAATTGL